MAKAETNGKEHKHTHTKGKIPFLSKDSIPPTKKFILQRKQDVSGTSGTGIVAVGHIFPSGMCFMEWTSLVVSWGMFNSIADLEKLHGHEGATEVIILEDE